MTTHKDLKLTAVERSADGSTGGTQRNGASAETNSSKSEGTEKSTTNLRQRLLVTMLPITLLPLGIASAVGYFQTESQLKEKAQLQLEEVSLLASETSTIFLQDAQKYPGLISSDKVLLDAVKAANQQVAEQGLAQKPVDVLEKQFASTKLLKPNTELNDFLKRAVKNADLLEIIVTNKDGLNVGYSSPTSDFVQHDERWWIQAKKQGSFIEEPEFDKSTNGLAIALSSQIKDNTGNMLGVMKLSLPAAALDEVVRSVVLPNLTQTEVLQIIDPKLESDQVVDTITSEGSDLERKDVVGGENILEAANFLEEYYESDAGDINTITSKIQEISGIKDVEVTEKGSDVFKLVLAEFFYEDRFYNLSIIPNTKLVTISSVSSSEEAAVAFNQLILFTVVAVLLAISVVVLVSWISNILSRQQEQALQEKAEARDQLEREIYELLDEVGEAVDGDLTVRASLSSMEMSTVADLFNAIIDNLNDIASQVKASSVQVSSSLDDSGTEIQTLAEQAVQETERARTTLGSIEQMSVSIEDVANNAGKAAGISDEAYTTVQEGSTAMDQTVDSILSLRNTVGETAKKIKRLGESSQKISQVVSLIEEIALKTNLLAINASVEASRAGEQGQGFTVVAEQVGALAEQSAAATKEIAQIVAGIQAETKEVTEAMEVGTSQVVDSTRLVEATKEKLALVLTRSQEINNLMQSISTATVSQTETSKAVTTLMQQMAELAEQRAASSTQVAQSMQDTATIAQKLEAAVAQFKLEQTS